MYASMKIAVQWIIFVVLICICFASSIWAGNKAMVEQNTKELDEINKQAVGQLSDLPKNGTVKIKANAKYKEGVIQFDVYDKKIISDTEEKEIKLESSSDLNAGSVKEETVNINNSNDKTNREKQGNDPKDN
jgi:hypothetical protein